MDQVDGEKERESKRSFTTAFPSVEKPWRSTIDAVPVSTKQPFACKLIVIRVPFSFSRLWFIRISVVIMQLESIR